MTSLALVRDLLLPGLSVVAEGRRVDLTIRFDRGCIVVLTDAGEFDLFNREEIEDGLYKTEFAPRIRSILSTRKKVA